MILLTAVIAATFAAVLIPFKAIQIIPGFASIRPAEALPAAFGLMFGPAGAWGVAIGNLIGDVFGGTLNPGSAFGFIANFFQALVAYKVWGNLGRFSSGKPPTMSSGSQLVEFFIVAVASTAALAAILGWGLDLLGLFPFVAFGSVAFLVGIVPAIVLGPLILYFVYPRVESMGLLYQDVLQIDKRSKPAVRNRFAAIGIVFVTVGWLIVGFGIGLNIFPGGSTLQSVLGAVGLSLLVGLAWLSTE